MSRFTSFLIICFAWFCVFDSYSQNIDSLENLLSKDISDVDQLSSYAELATLYLNRDLEKSLRYSKNCEELAISIDRPDHHFNCLYTRTKAYLYSNKLDSCKSLLDDIMVKEDLGLDSDKKGDLLLVYGSLYFYKADFVNASKSFEEAGQLFISSGNVAQGESASLNLAAVLLNIKDYDRAKDIFYKYLDSDNPRAQQVSLQNLSMIYGLQEQYEKSNEYLYKLLEDFQGHPELEMESTYLNLGINYESLEKDEKALAYFKRALDISKKVKNHRFLGKVYYNIAMLYTKQGRHKKALSYSDLALKHINEDNFAELRGIYINRKNIMFQQGRYKQAFEMAEKVAVLNDTIFSLDQVQASTDAEAKWQSKKSAYEIQLLEKEKELRNKIIKGQRRSLMGAAGGLGLLGLLSVLLFRQSKERRLKSQELALQRDQIDALHKDLAHRVKNNLSFISALMKMQASKIDNKVAKEALLEGESRIEAMSLLHRKLNMNEENTTVDIGEYLGEICANLEESFSAVSQAPLIHLSCENIRIDGDSAMRIGLIVNELVTNSYKHAFRDVTDSRIDISILGDKDKITLTYKDNGVGLPTDYDINASKSMGLKLINTLTDQLHGKLSTKSETHGVHMMFDFQSVA